MKYNTVSSKAGLFSTAVMLVALVSSTKAGIILKYNFESENPWSKTAMDVLPSTPLPVELSAETADVGTIVNADTSTPSKGLLLTAEVGDATGEWQAIFASGLLPVKNEEPDLGKLTLAFDYSVSISRPITLRFESFNADKKRIGGLETIIYPAAPDFYLRAAIDLSTMKPAGAGKFNAKDPYVQITYILEGPAFPSNAKHFLRIDNLNYSSPAYYVSPKGSDTNDGRTEKTPFLLPQHAVDVAKPGDIVLLMEGEYRRPDSNTDQDGIMHIESAGTPDAWMVFKNYPGQEPVVVNEDSWCAIRIGGTVRRQEYKNTPAAYIELRGLHIHGGAERVMEKYSADIGLARATTNGNGISGGGSRGGLITHHFRVANCISEYNPGSGMGFGSSDWYYFENNISRYNAWFTIYATSGMGSIGTNNFDTTSNVFKKLYRNNRLSWNRTYVPWAQIKKISDGNGLIVDVNNDRTKNLAYIGRVLIQNTVTTFNGGSGIHAYRAHQVDIVNNTAYMNGASPELRWGQIFFQRTDDAKYLNNVMYARAGQPVNTVGKDTSDKGNTNITRSNNLYFSGGYPPIMGTNDKIGDPEFLNPEITTWQDGTMNQFGLKPTSPARGLGIWTPITPLTDINGNPRSLNKAPDAGAFQN